MSAGRRSECRPKQQGAEEGGGCEWGEAAQTERWCVRAGQVCGRELYMSLSTVRTHMRHIYAKLGVHRRTEAVDRGRELGLLAPSARRR